MKRFSHIFFQIVENKWETGDLFEGDINFLNNSLKNGLVDENKRWPYGIIPLYINTKAFGK